MDFFKYNTIYLSIKRTGSANASLSKFGHTADL